MLMNYLGLEFEQSETQWIFSETQFPHWEKMDKNILTDLLTLQGFVEMVFLKSFNTLSGTQNTIIEW